MIKAEIQVGLNKYVLDLPDVVNLNMAYAYALSVAKGVKIHEGREGWLDLNKKDYDHIRVWEEDPLAGLPFGQVQPSNIAGPVQNPRITGRHLDYLGQKMILDVVQYEVFDTTFVMPYMLNGQPATNMVGRTGLKALVEQYTIFTAIERPEIVMPHGAIIDETEALAFITDYVIETEAGREQMLEDTDKTARGFSWPKE